MNSIRDFIANDGYAMSFQSMGQYRAALLKALDADVPAAPPVAEEVVELVKWFNELGAEEDDVVWIEPENLARAATLLEQLSDLAADAVAGMRYIEQTHGRLYGVGWDRVYSKADALNPQLSKH